MQNNLALELVVAVFKYEFEDLVVVIEYLVQYLYLQSWFQNLEDLRVLYLHGVVAELHRMETAHTFENQVRQVLILASFIKRNQPMIDLLLLIIKMIFSLDITEQVLERTNHVTVKTNSNHFDQDLVQVFYSRMSFDITITN